jgi:hypothetical protein
MIGKAEAKRLADESATVRLDKPVNWHADWPEVWQFPKAALDAPLAGEVPLVPIGEFQSTRLRGAIEVAIGDDVQLAIPVDMPLLPSINRWWVVGPFDAPDVVGVDRQHPFEVVARSRGLDAAHTVRTEALIGWIPTRRISEGAVVVEPVTQLTLSADHRVVDGAIGAKLLGTIRARLEDPLSLLV